MPASRTHGACMHSNRADRCSPPSTFIIVKWWSRRVSSLCCSTHALNEGCVSCHEAITCKRDSVNDKKTVTKRRSNRMTLVCMGRHGCDRLSMHCSEPLTRKVWRGAFGRRWGTALCRRRCLRCSPAAPHHHQHQHANTHVSVTQATTRRALARVHQSTSMCATVRAAKFDIEERTRLGVVHLTQSCP